MDSVCTCSLLDNLVWHSSCLFIRPCICLVADGTVHSPVDPVHSHCPGKLSRLGCTSCQQKKEISDEFLHHAVSISRSECMQLFRVFC